MKIALKRDFILSVLKKEINDPQEVFLLERMTDIQLYNYFENAGYISFPEECKGIVKEISKEDIDGKIIYEEIGFPLDLEYYLQETEI